MGEDADQPAGREEGAALAPSRMICFSSELSVISIDRTSSALSRES